LFVNKSLDAISRWFYKHDDTFGDTALPAAFSVTPTLLMTAASTEAFVAAGQPQPPSFQV
jgi:hypothetical protein